MSISREDVIIALTVQNDKANKALDSTTRKTNSFGSSVKGAAKALGGLISADQLISSFKKIAATVSAFEQSLKRLESVTGLQGDALNDLAQKAIDLSVKFGTSADKIVDGFGLVGSKIPDLLKSGDALAEVTSQADILSKAAGITLEQAIDALTKSLNQFGLDASEAGKVTDILATSQQRGTARITELSEALKNVGSVAAASGLDFEQTNVLLQALAKGGLEGAEAGTKLRSILLRLAKTGRDDLNPATQNFNDILKVLSSEVDTTTKAQKLFGEEAAAAALTLIKQRDVVSDLSNNLNEIGNAYDQAAINTDTFASAQQRALTAFDALVLSVDSGDGIFSQFFRNIADGKTNILGLLKAINDGIDSYEELNASVNSSKRAQFDAQQTIDDLIPKYQDGSISIEELSKVTNAYKVQLSLLNNVLKDSSLSEKESTDISRSKELILTNLSNLDELRLRLLSEQNKEVEDSNDLLSDNTNKLKKTAKAEKEASTGLALLNEELAKLNKELLNATTANERTNLVTAIIGKEEEIRAAEVQIRNIRDLQDEILQNSIALSKGGALGTNGAPGSVSSLDAATQTAQREAELLKGLQQQLNDSLEEGERKRFERAEELQAESLEQREQALEDFKQSSVNIARQLTGAEIAEINKRQAAQENTVDEIRSGQREATAEQLALEEARLDTLNEQREKALEKQRALAALEIGINSASTISEAIRAITKSFAQGGITAGVLGSVALAATVASSVLAVRSAISGIPAFAEGTEYFEGVGTHKSDSNLALLSVGERVVPHDVNQHLAGIKNSDLPMLAAIAQGRIASPSLSSSMIGSSSASNELKNVTNELSSLKALMQQNNKITKDQEVNFGITERGISGSVQNMKVAKNRINARKGRKAKKV